MVLYAQTVRRSSAANGARLPQHVVRGRAGFVSTVWLTLLSSVSLSGLCRPGACGGDLACSTCHVVLPKEFYDKLGEKQEEEDDMLDLAWGLTDT